MKILDRILNKIYNPQQKVGEGSGNGSTQDENIKPEPNGYQANAQVVMEVNPDGGKNTDLDIQTTESDIHDALQDNFNASTGDIYNIGTPERPQKKKFKDVDNQIQGQYFNNLETR